MTIRSVRFRYLIPASVVAIRTPSTAGIFGCDFGASGETVVDIRPQAARWGNSGPFAPPSLSTQAVFSGRGPVPPAWLLGALHFRDALLQLGIADLDLGGGPERLDQVKVLFA